MSLSFNSYYFFCNVFRIPCLIPPLSPIPPSVVKCVSHGDIFRVWLIKSNHSSHLFISFRNCIHNILSWKFIVHLISCNCIIIVFFMLMSHFKLKLKPLCVFCGHLNMSIMFSRYFLFCRFFLHRNVNFIFLY